MKLAGAVCDFTEPATGQNKLFFSGEMKQISVYPLTLPLGHSLE